MIYKMFISAQRVTWIILIENLEENSIREFLPKCKAIGLRKISTFSSQSIQFGPAMIYKMFISAQRVTWIILIENVEENVPKIFTKIQGYRLTKNLNFHGQLLSSQSIQFGPAMIYKMFISAQKVTWIILIENLEEKCTQDFYQNPRL